MPGKPEQVGSIVNYESLIQGDPIWSGRINSYILQGIQTKNEFNLQEFANRRRTVGNWPPVQAILFPIKRNDATIRVQIVIIDGHHRAVLSRRQPIGENHLQCQLYLPPIDTLRKLYDRLSNDINMADLLQSSYIFTLQDLPTQLSIKDPNKQQEFISQLENFIEKCREFL